jgi:signal transduction histidine kinase
VVEDTGQGMDDEILQSIFTPSSPPSNPGRNGMG